MRCSIDSHSYLDSYLPRNTSSLSDKFNQNNALNVMLCFNSAIANANSAVVDNNKPINKCDP